MGDAVPLARKSDDRPRTWHPSWIFLLCSPFHHLPVVSTPAACTARTNPPRRGRWRPARRTGQRRRRRVEPSSTKLAVTTPPGGSRRSRSRRRANRTQESVPDWLTSAAALRRATACSGARRRGHDQGWKVNETASGGGRYLKYRPPLGPSQPLD